MDYVVGGDTSLKINARGCNGVYINGVNKAAASALSGPVNIFPLLDSLLGD